MNVCTMYTNMDSLYAKKIILQFIASYYVLQDQSQYLDFDIIGYLE